MTNQDMDEPTDKEVERATKMLKTEKALWEDTL